MNALVKRICVVSVTMGAVSVAALSMAPAASASPTAPYVREGDTGPAVVCVQQALNHAVVPNDQQLRLDGIDGPLTTKWLKVLQANAGLATDGIVGPKTGDFIWYNDDELGAMSCYNEIPTDGNCPVCGVVSTHTSPARLPEGKH